MATVPFAHPWPWRSKNQVAQFWSFQAQVCTLPILPFLPMGHLYYHNAINAIHAYAIEMPTMLKHRVNIRNIETFIYLAV